MCYGLAPFYKEKIMEQLTPKTLNHPILYHVLMKLLMVFQSKTEQLDVHLIYFDEHTQKTKTVFNFSIYGSHTSIQPDAIIEVLKDLDYVSNMVQVSMDGPKVKRSLLYNLFTEKRKLQMHLT